MATRVAPCAPIEQATRTALASLGTQLGLILPPLTRVQVRQGTVALTTAVGITRGALTAPRALLCELLRKPEPTLGLRLWRADPGRTDPVSAALQRDGRAHDDWLALVQVVLDSGDREEAQLLVTAARTPSGEGAERGTG